MYDQEPDYYEEHPILEGELEAIDTLIKEHAKKSMVTIVQDNEAKDRRIKELQDVIADQRAQKRQAQVKNQELERQISNIEAEVTPRKCFEYLFDLYNGNDEIFDPQKTYYFVLRERGPDVECPKCRGLGSKIIKVARLGEHEIRCQNCYGSGSVSSASFKILPTTHEDISLEFYVMRVRGELKSNLVIKRHTNDYDRVRMSFDNDSIVHRLFHTIKDAQKTVKAYCKANKVPLEGISVETSK